MKKILFLLTLKIALRCLPMLAADSGIKIAALPVTTNASNTGYIPIIQPYPGRVTNDTFRISVTNLFKGRIITNNATAGSLLYWDGNSIENAPWYRLGTNSMALNGTDRFLLAYPDAAWPDEGYMLIGYSAFEANPLNASGSASRALAIGERAGNAATLASGATLLGWEAGAYSTSVLNSTLIGASTGGADTILNLTSVGNSSGPGTGHSTNDTTIGLTAGSSLGQLTGSSSNTVVGAYGMFAGAGHDITAIGAAAGYVAQGALGTRERSFSTFLGGWAGRNIITDLTITNAIAIGFNTPVTNSNEVVIGNAFNTRIFMPTPVIPLHTPASSAETNYAGAVTWDADYIYVWTSSTVNKRAALLPW